MSQIYVVLSRTSLPLWDNAIPESMYQYIYSFDNGIKRKSQVQSLSRHDPILLNAFRFFYGKYLEKCKYTGIKSISVEFITPTKKKNETKLLKKIKLSSISFFLL